MTIWPRCLWWRDGSDDDKEDYFQDDDDEKSENKMILTKKNNMKIDYYYPDILLRTGFNECNFDQLIYPFCHDPQLNQTRILNIDP